MGLCNYKFAKMLERMTAEELREVCRTSGMESRGTKSAMIDRILKTANPVTRTDMILDIQGAMARSEKVSKKRKRVPRAMRCLEAAFDAVAGQAAANGAVAAAVIPPATAEEAAGVASATSTNVPNVPNVPDDAAAVE